MMARRTLDVRVGPDVAKAVRHNKPVAAAVLLGFIILDSADLHVLRHAFGEPLGGIIAAVLVLAAIIQGAWRLKR